MTIPQPTECERHVITLADGVTMAFRRIPECPEGFLMGSRGYDANEEPVHRVVIPEPFWMAETPATQSQVRVWTGQSDVEHVNYYAGSTDLPAEQISWHRADLFCSWLTKTHQLSLPNDARFATLPSEAHWEYACRGGAKSELPRTDYHSGDGESVLREVGWFYKNSGDTTHVIGTVTRPNSANDFGLYDMHGNVGEWCLDCWDEQAYQRRWNGITALETVQLAEEFGAYRDGRYRVVRGGSFWHLASSCRSTGRDKTWPSVRLRVNGFRVCLVRSPLGQTAAAEPERTVSQRLDGAEMAGSDGEAEILNTNFTD